MKKVNNVLLIDKTDIVKQAESKKAFDISREDLRSKSFESFKTSDLVLIVDEQGKTNILKNRWGDMGIVVSYSDYIKYIRPVYENNKSNNSAKKKHIVGRILKFNIWPFNRS